MKATAEKEIGRTTRLLSGTAFAGVVLAFLLPFGSVSSCGSGEEVRFTGMQLATAQVPADESVEGGTLDLDVEGDATVLAFATLSAAIIGLALAIAACVGGGACAGAGLLGLQAIVGVGIVQWDEFDLHEGFGLSLLAFLFAGLVHLVVAVRARRRAGRRSWTYALRSTALAFSPILAVFGLLLLAGVAGA
jgi:hypothetical protein